MEFIIPLAFALAGATVAQNSTLTTGTTVAGSATIVSALTTVCGSATVLTQNGNYYTCTKSMTLTITDCPCTMTQPNPTPMYMAATPNSLDTTTTILVPNYCVSPPTTLQQAQFDQPSQPAQAGSQPSCPAAIVPAPSGSHTYTYPPGGVGTTMLPSATHGGYLYTNDAAAAAATGSMSASRIIALLAASALYALIM